MSMEPRVKAGIAFIAVQVVFGLSGLACSLWVSGPLFVVLLATAAWWWVEDARHFKLRMLHDEAAIYSDLKGDIWLEDEVPE